MRLSPIDSWAEATPSIEAWGSAVVRALPARAAVGGLAALVAFALGLA